MSIKGGIRKTSTGNYLAGSKMTVSCESAYTFYGYPEYFCHWNGTWLPTNNKPLSEFNDWPVCERNFFQIIKINSIKVFNYNIDLDYHIFGIKWSAVAIGSFIVLLFVGSFIYYCIFQTDMCKSAKGDDPNQKSYSKVTVINNLNADMVNNQDLDEDEDDYDLDENENEEVYEINDETDDYR